MEFFSQVKLLQKYYANDFKAFTPEIESASKKNIKKTLKLSFKGLTFGDKVSEVLTGIPFEHIPFDVIRSIYQDKHYPTILICVMASKNPRYHYEIITYLTSKGQYAKQFERTFDELHKGNKYPLISQPGLTKSINISNAIPHVSSNYKNTFSRPYLQSRKEISSISVTGESRSHHLKLSKPLDEDKSVLNGFSRHYPASVIDFRNTNERYQKQHNSHLNQKNRSSYFREEIAPKENSKYSTEARIFVNRNNISQRPDSEKFFNEKFENFGIQKPHQEATNGNLERYRYFSKESLLQNNKRLHLNKLSEKNEFENFTYNPRNHEYYADSTIKRIEHVKSEPRFHYTQSKQNYPMFSKSNYHNHSRGPSRQYEPSLTLQRSTARQHVRQNHSTQEYAFNSNLHKQKF